MPHVYGYWLEEIGLQTKNSIELVKKEKTFFSFRSVANRFSDDSPILLFNKAVVVIFWKVENRWRWFFRFDNTWSAGGW